MMITVEDFVKYMDNIIDSKKYSDRCVRNDVTFYCHKDLVDDAKKLFDDMINKRGD